MALKYKIGDKIYITDKVWIKKCITDYGYKENKGTIVAIKDHYYGIEYEKPCGGHDCNNHAKNQHGFWLNEEQISKLTIEEAINREEKIKKIAKK